ncbi:MAG: DUF362 domain-containing protein [Phycisphaerae bacterium]|nr:DUF362 domain-containing protein [Phycisphaerae bacterium]MDD5381591.1 DUF362 domain-containing protein [Phycisphaerae bacterium]
MPNPTVTLTRCSDYSQAEIARALAAQFELLGGLKKFVTRGDTVLLKPNLIAPRSRRHATQTDPAVLLETVRLLKDFGAKPFIGDSPAWSNVFACIKTLKLEKPLKKLSVPVKQLNKPKKCRIGKQNIEVGISSIALDADVIINMPKFKSHQQLVATFAVKNMFGCVSGKHKALWHFTKGGSTDEFCELLIEIYKFLNPALTIIDAVIAMDGPGPIRGRARPLGYILGGIDPFALEVICSRLVNINPENLPILKTARQMGLNCPDADSIKILGDPLPQNPCMDFELPQMIPVRFSLLQVCKSICKQILLLAKSVIKTKTKS